MHVNIQDKNNVFIIIIIFLYFFDPGTSFPRYGILSKCEMSGMATMETLKLRRCWTGRPH